MNDRAHTGNSVINPRVTISTGTYEASHGRKPRGRGSWMFRIEPSLYGKPLAESTFEARGTFTQARAQAKAFARDPHRQPRPSSAIRIVVLP